MTAPRNPWAVLGVEPTASEATVRAAYRRAVFRWHPDGEGGGNVDRFMEARAAYRSIVDGTWIEPAPPLSGSEVFVPERPSDNEWDSAVWAHNPPTDVQSSDPIDLIDLVAPPARPATDPATTDIGDVTTQLRPAVTANVVPAPPTLDGHPGTGVQRSHEFRVPESPSTAVATSVFFGICTVLICVAARALTQALWPREALPAFGAIIVYSAAGSGAIFIRYHRGTRAALLAALGGVVVIVAASFLTWAVIPAFVLATFVIMRRAETKITSATGANTEGKLGVES